MHLSNTYSYARHRGYTYVTHFELITILPQCKLIRKMAVLGDSALSQLWIYKIISKINVSFDQHNKYATIIYFLVWFQATPKARPQARAFNLHTTPHLQDKCRHSLSTSFLTHCPSFPARRHVLAIFWTQARTAPLECHKASRKHLKHRKTKPHPTVWVRLTLPTVS